MSRSLRLFPLVCLAVTICANAQQPPAAASGRFPFLFEQNLGQTAPQVRFLARSREGTLFFTEAGVTVALPHQGSFRILFQNANPAPVITAEQPLLSRTNYLGSDGSKDISGIKNFASLKYARLYPGVEVRFHGRQRHLEHEFVLAPGADPGGIALRLEGIDAVRIDDEGNAELKLGTMSLFESRPVAWQTVAGKTTRVRAEWKVIAHNRLTIALGAYNHDRRVVIDPVLAYSSHLGGNTGKDIDANTTFQADTEIRSVVLDPKRNVYVAGFTSATDFPTTAGAFDRTPNLVGEFHADTTTRSGFISKFDPSGEVLIYSTFLRDDIFFIAVDSAGHVYATKGGDDTFFGPKEGFDAGVAIDKLSIDGSRRLYSFRFGQTPTNAPAICQDAFSGSFPSGIAADNSGHVWVAGTTDNNCLPTTLSAFQRTMAAGDQSGFVAKFDTSKTGAASIVFSTFVGGSKPDSITGLAVDSSGNACVAGMTSSSNFPHTSSFGTAKAIDTGATGFVSKLNPNGSALIFSTLLHGVGMSEGPLIALDSSRNVYVAGFTQSPGFPTTPNAFQRTSPPGSCGNCGDAFVTKFDVDGDQLLFSTLLGGTNSEFISGLGVNNAGMAFVTGGTVSKDFPVTRNAFQRTYPGGGQAAFVTAFNASGKSLYYSTFLGGSTFTTPDAIFVDPAWNAWVVGNTFDSDFPVTPNAFQPARKGLTDGFIAKVVISSDLKLQVSASSSSVPHGLVVNFSDAVINGGPDGSDKIVLTDPIPAGFSFAGIFSSNASSCSTPPVGATSGTITCMKTHLDAGTGFSVHVALRATAGSGSNLRNGAIVSSRTQDLNKNNNSANAMVHVQ